MANTPEIPSFLTKPKPLRRPLDQSPGKSGDEAIRSTDDDAATSRASCARLGYLNDPFASLFVRSASSETVTRPPLINIGTFLRTWSIDRIVSSFLDARSSPNTGTDTDRFEPKQILSLGAGTDTRFFRLWNERQAPRHLVRYVEVDFAETIKKKIEVITSNAPLREGLQQPISIGSSNTVYLFILNLHHQTDSERPTLKSQVYNLVPGDLRTFVSTIAPSLFTPSSAEGEPLLRSDIPTLVIAECVLIYLPGDVSKNLLEWMTNTFQRLTCVLYEPAGLDNNFGRIMIQNLKVDHHFYQ